MQLLIGWGLLLLGGALYTILLKSYRLSILK